MNGDDAGNLAYLLLAVMLVGSAFVARKIPIGQAARMLLAWAAIFAVGAVVLSYRHDVGRFFKGRFGEAAVVSGGTVRVPMSEDGHFYVDATLDGTAVRLMVDSGATTTTLARSTAARAGIEPGIGFPVIVSTANGSMEVSRARVDAVTVGNIAMRDLPVHVAPNDDLDVIGMNFLSRLSRWSVEDRTLVLTP